MDRVCLAHGPDYESATAAFEDAAGPERFFYDKTSYTGDPKGWGTGDFHWGYPRSPSSHPEMNQPAIGDTPEMVGLFLMENPKKKLDDLGVPPLYGNPPMVGLWMLNDVDKMA